MPTRSAKAEWEGPVEKGRGDISLGSGRGGGPYSFASRFEEAPGTNPEELLGAALAGCFSMAFSKVLGDEGYTPERIETNAMANLDAEKLEVATIALEATARVPEIEEETFRSLAEKAKEICPVGKALQGSQITLKATLL